MKSEVGLNLIKRMIGKSNQDFPISEVEYNSILNDIGFWHEAKVRNLNVVRYKVSDEHSLSAY